jgi:hypothetical protein
MKTIQEYKLIQYRDAGLPTYTYFWVNESEKVVGPYFNSEQEAQKWMSTHGIPVKYEKFEDWFNEIENYGMRSERFSEELRNITPQRAEEWLRAAWKTARGEHD